MFLMEFYGDLPIKAPLLCQGRVFKTLDGALSWLNDHVTHDAVEDFRPDMFWFDPEDDRIVIYEINEENVHPKLVWHASGWHWQGDAADLPGGPLEQGVLPGGTMSLYDSAIRE